MGILLTGGSGFIGSNILEELINSKCKFIRILDNLSTGNKQNIQDFIENNENVEFMYGTIENLETCRKAMHNITHVCHQAALGSVPRSIDDPLSSHNSNVNGFLNLLIACKENNIKRFVYASSSSVYGDNDTLPKVEGKVGNVLSPYAATKKINEIYANVFVKNFNMELIGLRYFNVFGPRQNPNGAYAAVIPKFINKMIKGESPIINGSGEYSRDFTYIDNVVLANIFALTTNNKDCFGEVFNIGTNNNVSILELVHKINKKLNKEIQPVFNPERKGDVPHSHANINKAKNLLNYEPVVLFDSGLSKTIDYFMI